MGTSDLNATVEIKSGLQKDPAAWAQAATLSLDENGFRDPEGLGRAGAEPRNYRYFARHPNAAKHVRPATTYARCSIT